MKKESERQPKPLFGAKGKPHQSPSPQSIDIEIQGRIRLRLAQSKRLVLSLNEQRMLSWLTANVQEVDSAMTAYLDGLTSIESALLSAIVDILKRPTSANRQHKH
jgi:hypothetical protein